MRKKYLLDRIEELEEQNSQLKYELDFKISQVKYRDMEIEKNRVQAENYKLRLDRKCDELQKVEEKIDKIIDNIFHRIKSCTSHISHEIWSLKQARIYDLDKIDEALSQSLDEIKQEFIKGE